VSSATVYRVHSNVSLPLTETSELQAPHAGASRDLDREGAYGPLKVACERALTRVCEVPLLILRPGLLAGPEDLTDRFTYWPRRIAAGGQVLAPGPPDRRIQILDVRDLSAWVLDVAELGGHGTFNASGRPVAMQELIQRCQMVVPSDVKIVWIDEAFLIDNGVKQWTELPLWMVGPPSFRVSALSARHAYDAGLRLRPLEETAQATLVWDAGRQRPLPRGPVGVRYTVETLEPAREQELLRVWRSGEQHPGAGAGAGR
jgi:2'-hydroxyisoflavone reductase